MSGTSVLIIDDDRQMNAALGEVVGGADGARGAGLGRHGLASWQAVGDGGAHAVPRTAAGGVVSRKTERSSFTSGSTGSVVVFSISWRYSASPPFICARPTLSRAFA